MLRASEYIAYSALIKMCPDFLHSCLLHTELGLFWQRSSAVSMILLLGSFSSADVTFTRFLQMERHSLDLRVQNMISMMSTV